MIQKNITSVKATLIFIVFTVYFFLLLHTLLPLLKSYFTINSAVYWFITGYFLFIPLFVYALIMSKHEGNKGIKKMMMALGIKSFTRKDWVYSIIGLLLAFIFTALVFGITFFLSRYFGFRVLKTTPWFMEMHPFQGIERLLLLIWFPMFFFNIVGEEILWRGYIQNRLKSKYSWILCSTL